MNRYTLAVSIAIEDNSFHTGMVLPKKEYLNAFTVDGNYNYVYDVNAKIYDIVPYH